MDKTSPLTQRQSLSAQKKKKKRLNTQEELHDNPQGTKSLQLPALVIMQAVCPVQAELRYGLCLTFLLHKKTLAVRANIFLEGKKAKQLTKEIC